MRWMDEMACSIHERGKDDAQVAFLVNIIQHNIIGAVECLRMIEYDC